MDQPTDRDTLIHSSDASGEVTMFEDLLDLIGGRGTIEAATELFCVKVLHDDSLRHFFERVDIAQPSIPPGYVRFHAARRTSLYGKGYS